MTPDRFKQKFTDRSRLVNIHIPKTAGTTFREQVKNVLPLVPIDFGSPGDNDNLSHYERFEAILANTQARLSDHEEYFVSGHFRYRDLKKAAPALFKKSSVMTFLRNPINRMLSDYYYSISDVHPGSAAFLNAYPDFETYMRSPGQDNKQLGFLQSSDESSVDETIARLDEELAFVGITESYDACETWLFDHIGKQKPPPKHVNKNQNRDAAKKGRELYLEELREILRPEFKLYNHFKAMWQEG